MTDIATIDRDELKSLLDDGADIKLVMTLHEWAFDAMHIPGSIQVDPRTVANHLDPDDTIIVYCSDEACVASQFVLVITFALSMFVQYLERKTATS